MKKLHQSLQVKKHLTAQFFQVGWNTDSRRAEAARVTEFTQLFHCPLLVCAQSNIHRSLREKHPPSPGVTVVIRNLNNLCLKGTVEQLIKLLKPSINQGWNALLNLCLDVALLTTCTPVHPYQSRFVLPFPLTQRDGD